MSDQQCAFDNWQQAAEEVVKELEKVEETKQPENITTDEQLQQQKQNIKSNQEKEVKQAKQTLKQKIAQYKSFSPQNFQTRVTGASEDRKKSIKLGGSKILKNEKDFTEFAKQIAQRICQGVPEHQNLEQQSINTFFEELLLYLYDGLTWQNFFEIQKKLKVVKNERKQKEKKLLKQKQKKKNTKQQDSMENSKNYQDRQTEKDDLFGGAGLINSKQLDEQRKKIAIQKKTEKVEQKEEAKKQKPPPPPAEEEDDDFM